MSEPNRDLVLQISTSTAGLREGDSANPNEDPLTEELRHWLKPGTEIVLLFDGYIARTTIVWLAESGSGSRIEGCVRLLGVSARTDNDLREVAKPACRPDVS